MMAVRTMSLGGGLALASPVLASPALAAEPAGEAAKAEAKAETPACPEGDVCAARPQGVVEAMQAAGYRAVLKTSKKDGSLFIESATQGYGFEVDLMDCKADNAGCESLEFFASFTNDKAIDAEAISQWNRTKRYSTLATNKDGELTFSYDVTTVGGMRQANFADVLAWWDNMLGQFSKFLAEQPDRSAGKGKPKQGK